MKIHLPKSLRNWMLTSIAGVSMFTAIQANAVEYTWTGAADTDWQNVNNWLVDGAIPTEAPSFPQSGTTQYEFVINKPANAPEGETYKITNLPTWLKWGASHQWIVGAGVEIELTGSDNINIGNSHFQSGSIFNFLMSGSNPGLKVNGLLQIGGDFNLYNGDKTGYNNFAITTGQVVISNGTTNVGRLGNEGTNTPNKDHYQLTGTGILNIHGAFSLNAQSTQNRYVNVKVDGGTLNILGASYLGEWNGGAFRPTLNVTGGIVNALANKFTMAKDGSADVYLSGTGIMNVVGILDDSQNGDTTSIFNLGIGEVRDAETGLTSKVYDTTATARLNIGAEGLGRTSTGSVFRFGNGIIGALDSWSANGAITLVGDYGTIFDTEKQDHTLEGDNKGTGIGVTISLNSQISDGTIPQNEGDPIAASGKMIVKGPGTLILGAANTYSGGTDILSGTVQTNTATSLGTGAVSLLGETAILNLNNQSIANTINITNGNLQNAGNFVGHININQTGASATVSNVSLGNVGSFTGTINSGINGETVTTIDGIIGDMTLTGSNIIGINGSMANGAGSVVIGAGSVTLDTNATIEFKLTDALANSILDGDLGQTINLNITSGDFTVNNINDQLFINSSYSAFKYLYTISGVNGGNVVLEKVGNDNDIIITNDGNSLLVDSNNVKGFSDKQFVINNGKIDIVMTGTATAQINGLGGSATGVINTGDNENITVELSQGGFQDNDTSNYFGTIIGSAAINKTGEFSLVLANTVTASAVTISGGTLGFAALTGQTVDSVISGNITMSNGTNMTLSGAGLTLTAQNLVTGTNTDISFANGATLALDATANTTLNANVSGQGTILVNGQFSIGDGSFIGTLGADGTRGNVETVIKLAQSGQWGLDKNESAGGIAGEGTLALGGNTLTIGASNSIFEGTLTGANGSKIVIAGSGNSVQELKMDGNANVDLEVQSGKLILQNAATQAQYGDTVVQANGHLQIGSNDTNAKSANHYVDVKLASLNMQSGSSLTIFFGATDTEQIVSPTLTTQQAAVIGDNVKINVKAYDASSIVASGANQLEYVLINGETGTASISDSSKIPLMGFLSTIYDWKLSASGSDIILTGNSREGNYYSKGAQSYNANAVAELLLANTSAIASSVGSNLRALADNISNNITLGNYAEASRVMEAAGGSTVTSLGLAQQEALKDQMSLIRNRMTYMGVNQQYINEEMPYFNFWAQGTGGYNDLSSSGADSGYRLTTWGGTIGTDIDLSERLTVGAAFSASFGDLKASASDYADGKLDMYSANLFAKFRNKAWNHSLILTGMWSEGKLTRTVSHSDGSYRAHGKSNGSGFGGMYELTYSIDLNEDKTSILQPLVNISVAHSQMDAYDETGADNAGLRVGEQKMTTTTLAAGARWLKQGGSNLFGRESTYELRANVAQDMGDDRATSNVAFLATPDFAQTIRGAKVGKTALQIGGSVMIPVAERNSVFAEVNADFRNKQNSVNGSIGYRYSF